jgi:hypothetical protein
MLESCRLFQEERGGDLSEVATALPLIQVNRPRTGRSSCGARRRTQSRSAIEHAGVEIPQTMAVNRRLSGQREVNEPHPDKFGFVLCPTQRTFD